MISTKTIEKAFQSELIRSIEQLEELTGSIEIESYFDNIDVSFKCYYSYNDASDESVGYHGSSLNSVEVDKLKVFIDGTETTDFNKSKVVELICGYFK